jgi:hypothetical protein
MPHTASGVPANSTPSETPAPTTQVVAAEYVQEKFAADIFNAPGNGNIPAVGAVGFTGPPTQRVVVAPDAAIQLGVVCANACPTLATAHKNVRAKRSESLRNMKTLSSFGLVRRYASQL